MPIDYRYQLGFPWPVRSVSARLFMSVLGGALVGIGSMAGIFYRSLESKSIDQIQDTLNAQVQVINGQLTNSQAYVKAISSAVRANQQAGIQDAESYKQLVFEFFKSRPDLTMAVFFGQDAYQIVRDRPWFYPYFYVDQGSSGMVGHRLPAPYQHVRYSEIYTDDNYPTRDYWKAAIAARGDVWLEPYEWSGIKMTTFYSPFYNDRRQLLGIAGADVNISALAQKLKRTVTRGEGYFAVFSQEGKLLVPPPNFKFTKVTTDYYDFALFREVWLILQSRPVGMAYMEGQFLAYQRVPSTNWIAVAVVPESVVKYPIWRTVLIGAAIAALVLAFVVYAAVQYLNRRLQPIVSKCNDLLISDFSSNSSMKESRHFLENSNGSLSGNSSGNSSETYSSLEISTLVQNSAGLLTSESNAAQDLEQSKSSRSPHRMDELEFLSFSFERMSKQVQQSFQSLESANQFLQQTVAERTAALDQLQQAQIQLVQSEKMSGLGQMLAGIAHEINNPVNFIYGNLDHIKNYTTDLISLIHQYQSIVQVIPQNVRSQYLSDLESEADFDAEELAFIEEDLGKILGSMTLGTERIRQLVLSLRNFSRSDQGMHQPFQVNEGIESTLALLNHRLKANSQRPAIQVTTQLGDLPLMDCYPGPLNQVLMNLLANAIDALEERTARWDFPEIEANPNRLQIITRLVKSDSSQLSNSPINTDTIEIAITDNGSGIPPAIQAKIFDPFFTTKPIGKGTGIGLSISYQIIAEKHHGSLTCCSQPGQGTTFMIRLPLKQPPIPIAGVAHGTGGDSRAPVARSESLETEGSTTS